MNDKRLNELAAVLSTANGSNKYLQALREGLSNLETAKTDYDKAKSEHKKEFLKLSKERTKLEVVKDEIDTQREEAESNLEQSVVVMGYYNTKMQVLGEKEKEVGLLEKKTKASCNRKETAAAKALSEAETIKTEAVEFKAKYETKYNKLKAAIDE